jgi:hypothetical protein
VTMMMVVMFANPTPTPAHPRIPAYSLCPQAPG